MAEPLSPATPAPDFSLPDGEGNIHQLADLRGRNVVLAFYPGDRTPVCTTQLSLYQEVLDEIHGYDAELIAVSVDSQASHKAWVEEANLSFPLLSDASPKGRTAQAYGVYRESDGITDRALYIIDKSGTIRDTWVGEHPGVLPELSIVFDALRKLEGKPASDDTASTAIDDDDWSRGPADAAVTLLEYGDLECPDCGKAYPEVKALLDEQGDRIRYVWRHFPLSSSHPHAMAAAKAAEAAGAQGSFWEMVDLLLTHQQQLRDDDLRRYAQQLGLDAERFERDMNDPALQEAVGQDAQRGIRDFVNGTPTFLINGERYEGQADRAGLAAAIQAALMNDER